MRRFLLVSVAVLLASVGWSQTMTITFNDGSTVKYDMNKVKSIDFTSDDPGNGSGNNQETTSSLIGTWKFTYYESWIDESLIDESSIPEALYFQFRADGSFTRIEETKDNTIEITNGTWELVNLYLTFRFEEKSLTFPVIEISSDMFSVSFLAQIAHYVRVPDSEIAKYLNN